MNLRLLDEVVREKPREERLSHNDDSNDGNAPKGITNNTGEIIPTIPNATAFADCLQTVHAGHRVQLVHSQVASDHAPSSLNALGSCIRRGSEQKEGTDTLLLSDGRYDSTSSVALHARAVPAFA